MMRRVTPVRAGAGRAVMVGASSTTRSSYSLSSSSTRVCPGLRATVAAMAAVETAIPRAGGGAVRSLTSSASVATRSAAQTATVATGSSRVGFRVRVTPTVARAAGRGGAAIRRNLSSVIGPRGSGTSAAGGLSLARLTTALAGINAMGVRRTGGVSPALVGLLLGDDALAAVLGAGYGSGAGVGRVAAQAALTYEHPPVDQAPRKMVRRRRRKKRKHHNIWVRIAIYARLVLSIAAALAVAGLATVVVKGFVLVQSGVALIVLALVYREVQKFKHEVREPGS